MDQAGVMSGTDESAKFNSLMKELLYSSYRDRSYQRVEKQATLANLKKMNMLDYRYVSVENIRTVALLLHQLGASINPSETELVKSYSEFLVNILSAGGIVISRRIFPTYLDWFLEVLESPQSNMTNNILTTLQIVLGTSHVDRIHRNSPSLLGKNGILTRLAQSADNRWSETNVLALLCIEAGIDNSDNNIMYMSLSYMQFLKEILLNILSSLSYDLQEKLICTKVVCCCLRILRKLTADPSFLSKEPDTVGEILGVVKIFLFYGIEEYSMTKPQCLRPAAMNLPEVVPSRGNNTQNKARVKRQAAKRSTSAESNNKNLDSDDNSSAAAYCKYSSDSENEGLNSVHTEYKVRLEVLNLLNSAVRHIPPLDMFSYWPQIVASGSKDSARVLSRSLLKEPVAKVRQTVLSTLSKLLVKAEPYLVHADDSEHPSFVTFFGTVAAMIRELHLVLSLVLSSEKNPTVLTHALKCTSALVNGTPYARLKPGLATKLARNTTPHLLLKDPTVRVSALSVFEALALVEPSTPEILKILEKESRILDDKGFPQAQSVSSEANEDDEEEAVELEYADLSDYEVEIESETEDGSSRKKGSLGFLLRVCLHYISNEAEKAPVRLHSLKLLGALASNCESLVVAHLETFATMLATIAHDADFQVAHHACRVIDTLASRLATFPPENVSVLTFWNILFVPVTTLVQHSQSSLREVTCDCLGNIGSNMFSQLPRDRSILVITLLFGAARDEKSGVRAAAIRALGMLVTMPCLEEDTGFLMDLADIVCLASDEENLGVRVKAYWTLANLCDCLIRRKNNETIEPIPEEILLPRLYSVVVKAAEDDSKIKCNATRAVGIVIRLSTDKHILSDVSAGLRMLARCANSEKDMKVRWNACRALGFVISYKPDAVLPSYWREQVFLTLCDVIRRCPNFKVRTNAVWALAACDNYGRFIPMLWSHLARDLENAQHVPSFVEYPHRDALVQQLCLTLCHIAARTSASDLKPVWGQIRDRYDDVSRHMKHFNNNVLPEKADDLVEAKIHLGKLLQTTTDSEDQLIARSLADLFEKTQSYDDFGQSENHIA